MCVTGSGPHSPSLHLPSNPAPSMDEVTALPHGEMSVPIAASGSAGAFGGKSSLKCQVVFMLPAYPPPPQGGAHWYPSAQQTKLSAMHSWEQQSPSVPLVPPLQLCLLKHRGKGSTALGAQGRGCSWGACVSLDRYPPPTAISAEPAVVKLPLKILLKLYFLFGDGQIHSLFSH